MSRRVTIILVFALVAAASLAAVAAVPSSTAPAVHTIPKVHMSDGEGYFSVSVPISDPSTQGPSTLTAKVVEGDAYLVNVQAPPVSGRGDHVNAGDGHETRSGIGRVITVTGRYLKPGNVKLTILSRSANESFKPLMTIRFRIPEGESNNPEVRQSWAREEQKGLATADPYAEESFSHYWNLAVAPRYGLTPQLHEATARFRREPPDLYSVFTGAAAIQESLQLELLGSAPLNATQQEAVRKAGEPGNESLPLSTLAGPGVKSHPFREMLKGRSPELPALATFIPEDQYAVFFSNINKQMELADLMDEWGGNLLHQVEASARDFKVREKVSSQLCLQNSWLTRMFGDRVIADMAFTGSDPFLKEGTAFTVLFSLKDRERFRKQMEKQYAEAASGHGAKRSVFTVDRMNGFSVVSTDRRISSHTLIMGNIAIVSNSLPALQRIVAVSSGRGPSLAKADDFRYMRTIFPQNSQEEDIFLYLSDSHIRNLVGPRWKIGEARRMRCSGNMTMLANARLWFKTEKRREPTYQELMSSGYLGKTIPICPDDGSYSLDKNGQPCCSLHNRQGLLTPVGELPLDRVTPQESAQYRAFVENYNQYWTRFFDPIGIRVKMGKDIRIQTCILPLIENSWYDGMAAFSGRNPGLLTESALLPRTIVSLRGHMSPEWLEKTDLLNRLASRNVKLDWLGNEMALNLCDGQVLFSAGSQAMGLMGRGMGRSSLEPVIIGYLASAINLPTYLTLKVNDTKKAEQSIPLFFRALGPQHGRDGEFSVETYAIEDHRGRPLYVANYNIWMIRLRLYSAVVGDRLVIASRRDIVTDLMDAQSSGATPKPAEQKGNMELSVYRSAFRQLEETASLGWQEDLRHACHKNLPLAAILLRSLGVPADQLQTTATGLRSYHPYCPSGGKYLLDENNGAVACTVHGTRWQPKQPTATEANSRTLTLVNSLERINARMAFTQEGLMTTVEIKRK